MMADEGGKFFLRAKESIAGIARSRGTVANGPHPPLRGTLSQRRERDRLADVSFSLWAGITVETAVSNTPL
jgi:hypothetical protein